jgi:hypothetical protein
VQCSPVGEVTSCGSNFVPAKTKSILTGCIPRSYFTNLVPLICPGNYPVTQLNVTTPEIPGFSSSSVTACLTSESDCSQHGTGSPFTLITNPALTYCVVTPNGLTGTCSNYPGGVFTGIPLFDPTGANQVGCTSSTSECPTSFPVFFKSVVPAIDRCQASIVGQCPANYPTTVLTANNTIGGCQQSTTGCGSGEIPQSATATGAVVNCVTGTTCSNPAFPVALYDGSGNNGQVPRRCLSQGTALNCNDGNIFGMYNVEVYNSVGALIGCMKSNTDTPCPPGVFSPLMFQAGSGAPGCLLRHQWFHSPSCWLLVYYTLTSRSTDQSACSQSCLRSVLASICTRTILQCVYVSDAKNHAWKGRPPSIARLPPLAPLLSSLVEKL